ncbi:uncharacterized protein ColSpa_11324 [Colletotrichum spaethianum]|uniref:Uncharacterized protein n=1 Tax=Colletotrichum spaethianum TaxID=700344 RepID=A0AA37PF43_9PEZI|nr:uncharacterized protein ColSpa_11324 [Colletotrichum spaethianum]GKT51143.1 hypothetical protein ColSpa_11324 [Colletotrichum spaethianum]
MQQNSSFTSEARTENGSALTFSGRLFPGRSSQLTPPAASEIKNSDVLKASTDANAIKDSPVIDANVLKVQAAPLSAPKANNQSSDLSMSKEGSCTVKAEKDFGMPTSVMTETRLIVISDDNEERETENLHEAHNLQVERLSANLATKLRPILHT